jgi:glycosyltransferase involved in cell wall biosynthesis
MISIIIPHRNRSGLLGETLASLEAQTDPDWEAIVVDHGSSAREREAARELCARHRRVRFLVREEGPDGPSASRNLGLRAAAGDFTIFLDSDDLLAPGCLAERRKRITADPGLGFVAFDAALFEARPGDTDQSWNQLEGAVDLERFLRSDAPWCVSGPIWRTQTVRDLGGFDESVFYGDDAELHIRALLAGVSYRKATDLPPDHFIRRSPQVPRATQGMDPMVVASRIRRLEATSQALGRHHADAQHRLLWEGQYLVEAEFHLFRNPSPSAAAVAIREVFNLWRRECRPPVFRRWVVGSYLKIALLTRRRAYLVLRVARRIAMLFLPRSYYGK